MGSGDDAGGARLYPRTRNVGRGNACDYCRDMKVRCDGNKPVCGRCVKARERTLEMMRRRGASEEEIRAIRFQNCLEEAASTEGLDNSPTLSDRTKKKARTEAEDSRTMTSRISARQTELSENTSLIPLPGAKSLKELVAVCFEEFRLVYVFHPGRLTERLALSPTDPRYPHASVLHTFVALAYAARPHLDPSYVQTAESHTRAHLRHCEAARIAIRTAFTSEMATHGFDVARACLLMALKMYSQGDHLESYLAVAEGVRLCIMLNLNRDEELTALPSLELYITNRSMIRPNPLDDIEAEEMRRTMVMAFNMDRTTTIATLWPCTLNEEDFTADWPRSTLREFIETTSENVLQQPWIKRKSLISLHDLTTMHTPVVDLEQYNLKGTLTLGRCALYVSRIPRHSPWQQITASSHFQKLESFIAILQLESHNLLQLSRPSFKAGASKDKQETSSLTAFLSSDESSLSKIMILSGLMLPNVCTLMLHEPIAEVDTESAIQCKVAAQRMVQVLRLYASHASQEVCKHMDIVLSIAITLLGRCLIRQLEQVYVGFISRQLAKDDGKPNDGDPTVNDENITESIASIQADFRVVLLTLKGIGEKWEVATTLHDTLLTMLDFNPDHRHRSLLFAGLLPSKPDEQRASYDISSAG